jgi:hypothetical protein
MKSTLAVFAWLFLLQCSEAIEVNTDEALMQALSSIADNDEIFIGVKQDGTTLYHISPQAIDGRSNLLIRSSDEDDRITISCNGGRSLTFTDCSDVELDYIIFESSSEEQTGGAISYENSTGLVVDHCEFANLRMVFDAFDFKPGAIFLLNAEAVLTFCKFENNFLQEQNWDEEGYHHGSSVSSYSSNLEVLHSTFDSNISNPGGMSAGSGGAVYAKNGEISVGYCDFIGNSGRSGGAMTAVFSDFQCDSSRFTNNHSTAQGGAIEIYRLVGNTEITRCNFTNNYCIYNAPDVYGGAVYWKSVVAVSDRSLTMADCGFYQCSASDGGGAVYAANTPNNLSCDDGFSFSSIVIEQCTAYTQGGICLRNGLAHAVLEYIDVSNCENEAIGVGGNASIVNSGVENCAGGIVVTTMNNKCVIENVNFINNDVNSEYRSGGIFAVGGGQVLDTLIVRNSLFKDCDVVMSNQSNGMGAAILGSDISVKIDNTLFSDNSITQLGGIGRGSAVYVYSSVPVALEITSSTFADNVIHGGATNGTVIGITGPTGEQVSSLKLRGVDLYNRSNYSEQYPVYAERCDEIQASYSNIYSCTITNNLAHNWGWINSTPPANGNLFVDPKLTNDNVLKWDSILLDVGDPDSTDFDLTRSDIGWVPVLPEVEMVALPVDGQVHAAHYRLTSNGVLSAPNLTIDAGTAFRVEGNFPLNIYSSSGSFTMGDANGPRTSITTKMDLYSASSVVIGNDANVVYANLNGWLLKDLPATGVTFAGLNGIRFSPDLLHPEYGPNMQVMKTGLHPLKFINCTGDVVGVSVSYDQATNSWSTLNIGGGQMSVTYSNFRNNTNNSVPLSFASSSQSTVKDCVFNALNDLSTRFNVTQGGGSLYLRNNNFNNVRYRTIYNNMGNTMMDHGANNRFLYYTSGNPPAAPCVYSNYGRIDMECGYNAFVRFATPTGFKFVDTYKCFEDWDWSRNFWGTSLAAPLTCTNAASHVPTCADVSNCLSTWASNNPYWCPESNNPDEELWVLGQGAEENKLEQDAIYYYSELVRIYPASKFAPLAADRLKALGQRSPDLYAGAKAGLIDASLAAQAESVDWLKGMAQASSLLLDAQYEDREGAIAALDSLSQSADSLVAAHAQFARLEAETLPQYSLSASNPAALWAARERRLAAWDRMFGIYNDQSVTGEIVGEETPTAVPVAFALSRVYPNPFNPFATLEIKNSIRQTVDVVVYNMVGARVVTLHSGILEVGVHSFVFDGSKLASGMYIVQAACGSTVSSQKLILLK